MEHLADEFIRRRRSIVVGRGKRYPEELRQLAVDFATEARRSGWSGSRIAQRLGVAWATLERWCAMQPVAEVGSRLMREVVVHDDVPPSAALPPALVTPEGYRIDGLRQEELVEVLRVLRR